MSVTKSCTLVEVEALGLMQRARGGMDTQYGAKEAADEIIELARRIEESRKEAADGK